MAMTRSELMSRIRSKGTGPELCLRRRLRSAGIQHRSQRLIEGVRVDFAFPGSRLLVFIDGCFWHGCPRHGSIPSSNRTYWATKFRQNKSRDRRQARILRARGWQVLRIWEHEARDGFKRAILRIIRGLGNGGASRMRAHNVG
jgi:DNA mismatch endonuclease (patch repair protein)